jgi:predicted cupin superfamily sugar epimerase
MTQPDAADLIARLDLTRHPEGGWFRETYRSSENIPATALPERFNGSRALSTAIYFMLERGDFSALHQIKSDELWHHHSGSSLLIHIFIAESDDRFTEGLAQFLDDSGAELMGLTVLELLELVEIYRETFDLLQPAASQK